jgi:UDP-N-acetylmuramyl pentapeptide phosphotransferase/UDP-N-acetylglucosamine-1-phosphate transferase
MLFISFILFFFGILINYIVINNYKSLHLNILLDKEYSKPQSFHSKPILCFGGISLYILFLILFLFLDSKFIKNSFFLMSIAFILGLIDDLKIKLRPLLRLILIFILFFIFIYLLNINIDNIQLDFLNNIFKEYYYFKIFFISLCFVFIINGSNFIDGFNGLLIIHALIILFLINFINYFFNHYELLFFGVISFFIILSFFFFNFPIAKLFLGDGGSYLIGTLISYLIIETSNYNPNISSFFFCCLLYYLFFEVFFSFIRKFLYEKKNPLIPDKKHLHMLFFLKKKKQLNSITSNYVTGFSLNIIYFLTLTPIFYFYNNNFFLKYYFFILISIYSIFYYKLSKNK